MRIPPTRLLTTVIAALLAVPVFSAPASPAPPWVASHTVFLPPTAVDNDWTTNEIEGPLTMVGLTWSGRDPDAIQMRQRHEGSPWGPWRDMPIGDHAPDANSGEGDRPGTEALWVGAANAVQFRVIGGVAGIQAEIIDTTDRSKPFLRRLSDFFRPAIADAQPSINLRAVWDPTNKCVPKDVPDIGEVRAAFVHHTVNPNSYSSADVPAMLLATCLFHTGAREFDDIGYNFIVDRFGSIWEGRAGGIDKAIQGAHAQGFNSQSTGIAALGTFTSAGIPAAMEASIAELIAWKLPHHRADPAATVMLISGENEKYEEDALVQFHAISGHRDAQHTSCPGGSLYSRLPQIRATAAGLAPPIPPHPGPSDVDEVVAYHRAGVIRMGAFDPTMETIVFTDPESVMPGGKMVWANPQASSSDLDMIIYESASGTFEFIGLDTAGAIESTVRVAGTAGWTGISPGDFNGDGSPDLLFYRASDGLMRFYTITPENQFVPLTQAMYGTRLWTHLIAGDFNGDGSDDVLWYRALDGLMRFYEISDSGAFVAMTPAMKGTTNWTHIPAGDFTGDTKDDLLYYREDGLARGYTVEPGGVFKAFTPALLPSPEWEQITTGRFTGSSTDDLLWYMGTSVLITGLEPGGFPTRFPVQHLGYGYDLAVANVGP